LISSAVNYLALGPGIRAGLVTPLTECNITSCYWPRTLPYVHKTAGENLTGSKFNNDGILVLRVSYESSNL